MKSLAIACCICLSAITASVADDFPEANIYGRTRGHDAAVHQFVQLQGPIRIDVNNLPEAPLEPQGDADAAVQQSVEAREIAEQRFGADHAVTVNAARLAAQRAQAAGTLDVAIRELDRALLSARKIYPVTGMEITELTTEYADVLMQAEKFPEAAKVLEKRLQEEVPFPKETHALMIALLGEAYAGLKQDESARQLLAAVIKILEQQPEQDRAITAAYIAYGELGEMELAAGNIEQAIEHLRKAIEVLEVLDRPKSRRSVELYRTLASAVQAQQKPQSELLAKYFQLTPDGQAMYITRGECHVFEAPDGQGKQIASLPGEVKVWSLEFSGGMHRIYLPDLEAFGWVRSGDLGSFDLLMIETGKQKLQQALQDKPQADLDACLAAFERARPAEGFDDPQQGISVIKESLATIQLHYKNANALSALLYEDLIGLYQHVDDHDELLRTVNQSLKHFLFGHGFQHPVTATVRLLEANRNGELGDYDAEANELEECLKISRVRFGARDPRTQGLQLRWAANQIRLGSFEQAEQTYQKLLVAGSDSDQPSLLHAIANRGLGGLAASRRDPTRAAVYLQKAVDDFEALNNPVPTLLAQSLQILGYCHGEIGEAKMGLERSAQAEQIAIGPTESSFTLSLMTWKSRLAARGVSKPLAMETADAAIQFAEENFGKDSMKKHDPQHAMAMAMGRDDVDQASQAFESARRTIDAYRQYVLAFHSEQRKISFLGDDRERLDQALTLGLDAPNDAVLESAVVSLVNGHHRLPELLANGARARARATTQDDLDAMLLWRRAANDTANVPLKTRAAQAPSYFSEEFARLDARQRAAFGELSEDVKSLYPQDSDWIELDRIRKQMVTGEVLLLFRQISDPGWLKDPRFHETPRDARPGLYVLWIVPAQDAGSIQSVQLGLDQVVNGAVSQATAFIDRVLEVKPHVKEYPAVKQAETNILAALGNRVWKPIESKLPAGTSHLTLCLDGDLHNVPWAALPTLDGQMLVDRYTMRQVISARDLLSEAASQQPAPPQMLIDPEIQQQDSDLLELSKAEQTFLTNRTRGAVFRLDKAKLRMAIGAELDLAGDLLNLLGTNRAKTEQAAESSRQGRSDLSEAFGAAFEGQPQIHQASRASEYRYFATSRPRALHITAPVFAEAPVELTDTAEFTGFESQALVPRSQAVFLDPLMQCGVLLAGYGLDEAKHHLNDGVLTGQEIVSQDLRGTELVTLSVAPRSPSGGWAKSEALAILPHAFQLAGARAVLSSSWDVDEPRKQQLLVAFYEHLAGGEEKAAALRAAQLEIRDQSGAGALPAAFWASFRLTGEGWREQ